MSDETTYSADYHGSGIRAWLTCTEHVCRWELSVANLPRDSYHQAETEVLLQPCGDDGLAVGGPVCLFRSTTDLVRFPGGDTYWGNTKFPPGISPELARHCHFRVRIQVLGEAGTLRAESPETTRNSKRPP